MPHQHYSIFEFGDLFQLDSPLIPTALVDKGLVIEFEKATLAKGIYTISFRITPQNINLHHLQATVTLSGLPGLPPIINRRQLLSNNAATYSLDVAATLLVQQPGKLIDNLRFILAVSCDGVKGTSAPFVLQSEAAALAEASDQAAVSTSKLPHPVNYSFSQVEIDKLVAYAEAYSKGKYPDAQFQNVLSDEAKAARADAHEDLRNINPLIQPQGMQDFLRNEEEYINTRARQTNQNPNDILIDTNLCIHLYTRLLSTLKYNDADKYTVLRTAARKGPKKPPDEQLLPTEKNNVRLDWKQDTQSDVFTWSDEAIRLAEVVPSARINDKIVDLPFHLIADFKASRKMIDYPARDGRPNFVSREGDPTQINPHVGYFLESYLKDMPVDKFYLFGLGLGNGYHSIMIAAKRIDSSKNQYIIIDDHMLDDFRIAGPKDAQSLTHERKTSEKKIVDYFIQAYTGGAWGAYTSSTNRNPLPTGSKGWPLVTRIYILRPKQLPASPKN